MRLFVAIDLPDRVRTAIAQAQQRLRAALGDAAPRWIKPEQLHLTLLFIGERDEVAAAGIVDVMGEPVPLAPFTFALGGIGVFPPHGAPRILWLGLVDGAREVSELHRLVAARLARVGVAPEDRAFHPHLTIGRWREGRPAARRGALEATADLREAGGVAVQAVTLYRSQLGPAGPAYTALTRAPLACR